MQYAVVLPAGPVSVFSAAGVAATLVVLGGSVGAAVVSAVVVGAAVVGAAVLGAAVLGAAEVGAAVVGAAVATSAGSASAATAFPPQRPLTPRLFCCRPLSDVFR